MRDWRTPWVRLHRKRAALVGFAARFDIAPGGMTIRLAARGLHEALGVAYGKREKPSSDLTGWPVLEVPFAIRRRGVEARHLGIDDGEISLKPLPAL